MHCCTAYGLPWRATCAAGKGGTFNAVNRVQILSVPVHCFGSDLAPDPWEYDSPSRKPRTKACYLHASVLTFGVQHAPPRPQISGARNPGEKVPSNQVPLAHFIGLRHTADDRPLLARPELQHEVVLQASVLLLLALATP